MLQLFIIQFLSIICQVVAYGRLKKQKQLSNFSKSGRSRLKEVPSVVIWLGNSCTTGRCGEVLAYERC